VLTCSVSVIPEFPDARVISCWAVPISVRACSFACNRKWEVTKVVRFMSRLYRSRHVQYYHSGKAAEMRERGG